MRGWSWGFGIVAVLACVQSLSLLLAPVPTGSDAAGFALLAIALLFGYVAAVLATERAWWHWWIPAAWIGLDVAALFLAYKDSLWMELAHFGPLGFGWQLGLHALIGPIEIGLGFAVGFIEPDAWIVVLLCVALAILGAEILRRRMWPREAPAATGEPASR